MSNFIKIHPVKTELLHAVDGQTDRQDKHDEANNRFQQFLECA